MIVLKLWGFGQEAWCRHARELKIYLTHPNDLRRAFQHNREHPFFHDLRNGNCDFLFPMIRRRLSTHFPNLLGVSCCGNNTGLLSLCARLADYLPALLRPAVELFGRLSLSPCVVAKSQQAIEKVTKGYLLWHSQSFDPTKGHAPFTYLLQDQPPNQRKPLKLLTEALNHVNKRIVKEILWLESLAPKPPAVPEAERGNLQPLNIILVNTEYPFWSSAKNRLLSPAEGITLRGDGIRAFKAARTYFVALAKSDPRDYSRPIQDFLDSYPLSTEVTEWPSIGE